MIRVLLLFLLLSAVSSGFVVSPVDSTGIPVPSRFSVLPGAESFFGTETEVSDGSGPVFIRIVPKNGSLLALSFRLFPPMDDLTVTVPGKRTVVLDIPSNSRINRSGYFGVRDTVYDAVPFSVDKTERAWILSIPKDEDVFLFFTISITEGNDVLLEVPLSRGVDRILPEREMVYDHIDRIGRLRAYRFGVQDVDGLEKRLFTFTSMGDRLPDPEEAVIPYQRALVLAVSYLDRLVYEKAVADIKAKRIVVSVDTNETISYEFVRPFFTFGATDSPYFSGLLGLSSIGSHLPLSELAANGSVVSTVWNEVPSVLTGVLSDADSRFFSLSYDERMDVVGRVMEVLKQVPGNGALECYSYGRTPQVDYTQSLTRGLLPWQAREFTSGCVKTAEEQGRRAIVSFPSPDGTGVPFSPAASSLSGYLSAFPSSVDIGLDLVSPGSAHEFSPLFNRSIFSEDSITLFPARTLASLVRFVDVLPSDRDVQFLYFNAPSSAIAQARHREGAWTEELQAEWVSQVYRVLYAHPRVRSLYWMNVVDEPWRRLKTGLFRADLSMKPAGEEIRAFISSLSVSGVLVPGGSFTGYPGVYDFFDGTIHRYVFVRTSGRIVLANPRVA